MKYAIDRIEEDIAILENLETKEKLEVALNLLPENAREQAIVKLLEQCMLKKLKH